MKQNNQISCKPPSWLPTSLKCLTDFPNTRNVKLLFHNKVDTYRVNTFAKSARKSQTEVNKVPRFANPDPGFATKPEVIFSTSNLRI